MRFCTDIVTCDQVWFDCNTDAAFRLNSRHSQENSQSESRPVDVSNKQQTQNWKKRCHAGRGRGRKCRLWKTTEFEERLTIKNNSDACTQMCSIQNWAISAVELIPEPVPQCSGHFLAGVNVSDPDNRLLGSVICKSPEKIWTYPCGHSPKFMSEKQLEGRKSWASSKMEEPIDLPYVTWLE